MIRAAAPARVGILGNPSDGYGGRTLALAVPQLEAVVELAPADGVEIVADPADAAAWPSVAALGEWVDRYGYGTGTQLLAAAVRTYSALAASLGRPLQAGFRLSYRTTIPRQVGLGGSSALVVAALRCLERFHPLDVPDEVLPSLALKAETVELGLSAGLQDRVVQAYGGLVAMDFTEPRVDARFGVSHGSYERLDPASLPPLFVAYREEAAQPSDSYHRQLRARFDAGDPVVRDALRELAHLVIEGRAALRWGDQARFGVLIERNMQLRLQLGSVPDAQLELVEVARAVGSRASFAGSGGAVVGTVGDGEQLEALRDAYADVGADLLPIDLGTPGPDDDTGSAPVDNVVSLDRRPR